MDWKETQFRYIRYTLWAFTNLSFYHAFLREILTELHTNKWAMWFETAASSDGNSLHFSPYECWSEENLCDRSIGNRSFWLVAQCPFSECTVMHCVSKRVCELLMVFICNLITAGIIRGEYKLLWGGVQKYFKVIVEHFLNIQLL